jgi:hypothetical protein
MRGGTEDCKLVVTNLGCTRLKNTHHDYWRSFEKGYEWLRRQIPSAQASTVGHVRYMTIPVIVEIAREARRLAGYTFTN